jgi:hypothetical protein
MFRRRKSSGSKGEEDASVTLQNENIEGIMKPPEVGELLEVQDEDFMEFNSSVEDKSTPFMSVWRI